MEKTSTVGRESDKFMLRLPDGMREQIAEAAKANSRSMNAEIVSRLLDSFLTKDHGQVMAEARDLYKMAQDLMASSERLVEQHKAQSRSLARLATNILETPHPDATKMLIELAKTYAEGDSIEPGSVGRTDD